MMSALSIGRQRVRKSLPVVAFVLASLVCSATVAATPWTLLPTEQQVEDTLIDNINSYLAAIPDEDWQPNSAFYRRVQQEIAIACQAVGYFHCQADISPDEQGLAITFTAGEVARVSSLDVAVGEAQTESEFQQLLATMPLQVGQPLHQFQYQKLKSSVEALALKLGYFDGKWQQAQIRVARGLNEAHIVLRFDSGARYHFAAPQLSASHIDPDKLSSFQTFQAGDNYHVGAVGEYQQRLAGSNWYSAVSFEQQLDSQQKQVTLVGQLVANERNTVETSLGYSTDLATNFTVDWTKPWFNREGHSTQLTTALSQPEQQLAFQYRIPLQNAYYEYYSLQSSTKRKLRDNIDSLETNLIAERFWNSETGWQRSAYIRALYERYLPIVADDEVSRQSAFYLLPGLNFTRTRSDGLVLPLNADKQWLNAEFAAEALGSSLSLIRLQGRTGWIRDYQQQHRMVWRLDFGAVFSNEASDTEQVDSELPPSLRFLAGGDNSIRGYGYQEIGVLNSDGVAEGGHFMVANSLEYQYRLAENWWLASFYDVGSVWDTERLWSSATGLGFRWQSPIGVVRFDIARGNDVNAGKNWQFHFAIGPEL